MATIAFDGAAQPPPPPAPPPPPYAPPPPHAAPYPYPYPYPAPYPAPPHPDYQRPPAPPPAPKPSGPPSVIYGWDPDVPAPDGFRRVSDPNAAMIGAGVAMLTIGWVSSSVVAAVGASLEDEDSVAERDDIEPNDWAVLSIPIAGPAVAIATLRPPPSAVGLFVADSIVQLGGLVAIVVGALDERHNLVSTKLGRVEIELSPSAGPNEGTLSIHGRF